MSSTGKGMLGEKTAAAYMKNRGFRIVTQNYRAPRGEIDLIATFGDLLCFIEVKTWDSYPVESIEQSIDRKKQRKIISAARYFLATNHQFNEMAVRFDVIILSKQRKDIKHIMNAFVSENG